MKKKNLRIILDIAMTVLLPMLMAYSLIGETFHEVIGTATLVLFVTHHILNRKWYKGVFIGKQTAGRIIRTALDLLLLILMLVQPISGILMSKHLYTFIQLKGISAAAREIHLMAAYWSFVLCCIHAGMHLVVPMNRLKKTGKTGWLWTIGIWVLISVYGVYAFIKRQIPEYMFRKTLFAFFDYSEPRLFFFLDYLSIMLLFGLAGYLLVSMTSKKKKE